MTRQLRFDNEEQYQQFLRERDARKGERDRQRAAEDDARQAELVRKNTKGGLFHEGGPKPLEERKTLDDGRDEHWHQAQFVSWARERSRDRSLRNEQRAAFAWLHAVPNGAMLGGRNPEKVANKLRAEGMTNGVADLFLPYPAGRWHGLYVEMKSARGRVRPEQREFLDYAASVGYRAVLCRSWAEAANHVVDYLELGEQFRVVART